MMSNINETKLNKENEIAESFSKLCIKAYECLQMYKIMYTYEDEYKIVDKDKSGIWGRFGEILRHYWVLQIAKINDPEELGGHCNFSLAYFVARVVDKDSDKGSYKKFKEDNKEFIEAIRTARVKVVAHRDLEVFNSPDGVGAFPAGLDENYFNSLHEIISEGYKELGLGFFPEWPSFIVDDTKNFMDKMLKIFGIQQSS